MTMCRDVYIHAAHGTMVHPAIPMTHLAMVHFERKEEAVRGIGLGSAESGIVRLENTMRE